MQTCPPFSRENGTRVLYSRKWDTCSLSIIRKTKHFLLFSERSFVNIDSNDFDKAGYEADILSTYFHDDR